MSEKIKVIIKRPDEKLGHIAWISNKLENFQRTVEGYIECVWMGKGANSPVMIVNEEGKLEDLDFNFWWMGDAIVGTVIIAGDDGYGNFTDVPITRTEWAKMLKENGNQEEVESDGR